jgi:hypothetical protein
MAYATNNFGHIRASTSVAVAIAAVGTWYAIPSGFTAGLLNSFSLSGANGLVCNGAGTFYLTAHVSLEAASANQKVQLTYAVNGVPAPGILATTVLAAGNAAGMFVGDIVALQGGDVATLMVKNLTGANALTVDDAQLSIARLQR